MIIRSNQKGKCINQGECVCVCVCVRERERGVREGEKERLDCVRVFRESKRESGRR